MLIRNSDSFLRRLNLPLALVLCAGFSVCLGDEPPAGDASPAAGSAASEVEIKVDGVFEASRSAVVSAANEHLTELKIERIVPFGAMVTTGQPLVWFETRGLDDKIRGAETDLALAQLDLESDQFGYQQFLKQQSLDKSKTIRARKIAQQEFDNYQRVDRERTIKQAQFSLSSSEFSLDSASEELRQLEQMYKEDDLTEESEEIVLRRAKQAMESAQFSLERVKLQTERTLKQSIPRDDATQDDALARALIDFDKAIHALAIDKQKRDLELDRKRIKVDKQAKDLEGMRDERKKAVLKSEIDGIFVYGEVSRGRLPAKQVEWQSGNSVGARQVIGTVLDTSKLRVRVDLPEEHLARLRSGTACNVIPKAIPDHKLDAVVKSVGMLPITPGKYDVLVTLRGKIPAEILPAMSCVLHFSIAEKSAVNSAAQPASESK